MVIGIEKFREYFAGYENKYVVIGGTACSLLFNAAGLPFRATRDIDMVLCVEVVDKSFGEQFSAFLEKGGNIGLTRRHDNQPNTCRRRDCQSL